MPIAALKVHTHAADPSLDGCFAVIVKTLGVHGSQSAVQAVHIHIDRMARAFPPVRAAHEEGLELRVSPESQPEREGVDGADCIQFIAEM